MKECSTCIFCYVDKTKNERRRVFPSGGIAREYKEKYSNLVIDSYKRQKSDVCHEYIILSDRLYCRRYPPNVCVYEDSGCNSYTSINKYSEFAEVEPDWVCGEYKGG